MRWPIVALATILAQPVVGCGAGNDSELLLETSAPLDADPEADVALGERAWVIHVAFAEPIVLDRRGYGVLVRLPAPIGTDDEMLRAAIDVAPDETDRRVSRLAVSGKHTFLRRGLPQGIVKGLVVRVTTNAASGEPLSGPASVAIGGAECLTGLADEWQARQFGNEPVRMAYAADCAPR